MKKILLCVTILAACAGFSLTSCSKIQEKKAREQFVIDSILRAEDSIRAAEIRIKFIADSINNIRLDSLSQIAWGQTKFGMSYKEALKTETCSGVKGTSGKKDRISLKYEDIKNFNEVMGLKHGLSYIILSFEEDELESVHIKSNERSYSSTVISDIIYDMKKLQAAFTSKYGEPTAIWGEVQNRDFAPNEEHRFAGWEIKNKRVNIYFKESFDHYYYYRIVIANRDYPRKKHVDTPEEIAEKERKKKEADQVKNNSF